MQKNRIGNFDTPTKLPMTDNELREWQKANYYWWQNNPMRYDWGENIGSPELTKEFYLEIDKRFFEKAREFLDGAKDTPFDEFIDFSSLKDKTVLEIGVGNGSHAQLLTKHAKMFSGIDITDYAVKSTNKRMELFGLKANILKMDAEKMEFADNSFDFIWSWGVIHHSANTKNVLTEMKRVLRPGGKAVLMVYYRGWWNYYLTGIIRGLVDGSFFRGKNIHDIIQLSTDGAIARYYTISNWRKLVKNIFQTKFIEIYGPKSDLLLLPNGKIKDFLMGLIPNKFVRFLTHDLRMGTFLVAELEKA
jgi:SAM-dependent methyltransferase